MLGTLYQSGSAKALLPRTHTEDLQAVLLNTAGGITGGDRFDYRADVLRGARLSLSTQAAERAYRAHPDETGQVEVAMTVEDGARLSWLPQETILFDGARLRRRLAVDLTGDAQFIAVEAIVFGRTAMGERLNTMSFRDTWTIRRDGALIFKDALRFEGDGEEILSRPATLDGHRAMASILLTCAEAERRLPLLRAALKDTGGASLIRDGVLAARLTAPDGFTLRKALLPALETLTGKSLPKVWTL
ncbi:MAG: urease accessory protein UreD [Pseudomonadota bacterium]